MAKWNRLTTPWDGDPVEEALLHSIFIKRTNFSNYEASSNTVSRCITELLHKVHGGSHKSIVVVDIFQLAPTQHKIYRMPVLRHCPDEEQSVIVSSQLKAGGTGKCNPVFQTAFTSPLATGSNCDQQNTTNSMVNLTKSLNNDPEMIRLAQLFVQQARNVPNSLQVPYCQQASKNVELTGLFHCQFTGSKFSSDQTRNLLLGIFAVNPLAHPL
ncbi:proline-rich protein [Salix suchowensis]|nr:proline-rich protein [Salix suchowensis]